MIKSLLFSKSSNSEFKRSSIYSVKFVLSLLLFFASTLVYAQAGKDGALTISTTNTVLNRYTRVTADIPIGSNSLTVVNINELNRDGISYLPSGYTTNSSGFASNALAPGDLILLFQAQGAVINTTNSLNYGEVTNLNNAGRYEMAYVGSVSGNTITLDCKTRFAYFAANYVQCIRIPQYTTLTVNSGASVVPIRWGDPAFGGADPSAITRRRGGFLGVLADNIVNEGSINANFAGFRGGTFFNGSPPSGDVFYSNYFYNTTPNAGEKGEGIAGYRPDYDALGGRYGMGAPANAGGGGNGHNCGGGGGANGGDPSDWFRGAGVMNHFGTCGNPGAWALDPNYIANGNALTNSAGGGRGGYSFSSSNANACTSGPSYPANFISPGVPLTDVLNTAWGGDRRKALGGLGGRPLVSPAIDRQIFYGGGGGAGDGNNNASSDGGDGGGIVFLIVENGITGSGVIQANGEAGSSTRGAVGNDAPGGGGAGGTVLVQANSVGSGIAINADGGNGGIQIINLGNEGEGPGGGGGGGAIYMNSPSDASTKTVNGGANGTTNSLGTTEFIANGATSGNVGSLRTASVEINFNLCLTDLEIIKTVDDLTPKFGDNVTFTLTASNLGQNNATNVVVNDLLPSGYTFISSNPSVGTYDEITGEWTFGSLDYPSSSETLEIVATVNPTGVYSNTATISADEPDPEPDNNTSTVTPVPSDCDAGPASSTPSVCINSAMTAITHATTAATGIGTPTGLPAGVTASWSADIITISGTPTVAGTYNYSIPLETGCDLEVATGTITVILNTATAVANQTVCVNTALTPMTQTTTGATGIGTPTGLPAGVTASWSANVITISGTPTESGTFNYTIPLTGGCDAGNATGTIIVNSTANTVSAQSSSTTRCVNSNLTPITHTTTGATGIGTPTGLPPGVSAAWSANTITIFSTPTATGVYNYTIPLIGGCGGVNATGTITINGWSTVSATTTRSTCIGVPMTTITRTTTFASGMGSVTGLPPGVSASWAADVLTISGTPTTLGTYNYTIFISGICGSVNATGTIIVVSENTPGTASSNPTLCINTALTAITRTTGAATGIGTPTGLPAGVTASWNNNVITVSGTPTEAGTFNYSIPLTGGCGDVNATGTITVNPLNTASVGTTTTLCINTALSPVITHTTTGATGIHSSSGLPTGVTASWSANTITISGTPTTSGTSNYSVRLNGGCGIVNATGTIIRTANNTVAAASNPTLCINTAMTTINRATTGATGIANDGVSGANGLPAGVSATWASNTLTISGTPTVSGTFNYSILLTGGCGTINATGTITVNPASVGGTIAGSATVCTGTNSTVLTLSGHTGSITRWQYSGVSDFSSGVNNVTNTTTTLTATNLTATRYYRAQITSGVCALANSSTATITVTPNNTAGTASANPTICINTALTPITRTTTGATGIGSPTGLPTGVSASWNSNVLTVSGTPTNSGTFNYTIPLTGGCGTVNATGTITVNAASVGGTISGGATVCTGTNNTVLTLSGHTGSITRWEFSAVSDFSSGINNVTNTTTTLTATNLTATRYYRAVITNGVCALAYSSSGIIVITPSNTAGTAPANPNICVNTALTPLTRTTTGATGIGTATGLPAGVTASWSANTLTLSGTPTATGTFNYTIPLTGGCGSVNATGTITVISQQTVSGTANQTVCINTPVSISRPTTGATSIGTPTGLPAGVSASWSANVISITGSPTASGTFNYSIPLSGGCGSGVNATGTITVNPDNTASAPSTTPTVCENTSITSITHTTTRATGIGSPSNLPTGVTASWSSNTITISGTPTQTGTFNYSIPLTGGCGTVNATGTIIVNPNGNGGTISGGGVNVCTGTNSTNLTLSGYTGSIVRWQYSSTSDFSSDINDVANTTASLTATNLTATRYYRAFVSGGSCGSSYSDITSIIVDAASNAGTISGVATACEDINSTTLTLSGNVGTIQWQSSTNNVTFNNISGETSATYTSTNLSATTYYRVNVTSGSCGTATSATHTITVVSPSISDPSLASGDYVWRGSGALSTDSVDWLVPSNWYVYDGSNYTLASTLPTKDINVFIPGVGTCFRANPHIFTATTPASRNLTILSSGHLTMHTGKLSVAGNWVNNGIFTCGTGQVIFIEQGYHTIGGTVSVNAFYDFRMNKPADGETKSVAYLLKQATIAGTMTLTVGLFDINVFNIDMDDRPIIGGSPASYVRTSSTGSLRRNVQELEDNVEGSHVRFPVGRSRYNPAHLNNYGVNDIFGVRVFDKVTDDSYEESPLTTLPVVERTWMISESVVGGSDVDMQLYWNGTLEARIEEINDFDYNTAYIAHYNYSSPTWENKGGNAPGGPGYAQQNGITDFSPFTISSEGGLGWTGPLPVELLDFTAKCLEDNTVQIDWSTASENNSSHFEVRKSINGYTWNTIETVPSAGNSTELLNYSVLDRDYTSGNAYYRLKQFDIDGKYEHFDVVNVNCDEEITSNKLIAYPNPSSTEFFVDFNSETIEGKGILTIVDTRGVIVYSKTISIEKGNNFFTIDDLKVLEGVYYINLQSDGFKSNVVKQVIK